LIGAKSVHWHNCLVPIFKFESILKGGYVHLILLKMLSINTKKVNLKRFFSSLRVKLLLFLGEGTKIPNIG
jgi:hypothetical protein